MDARQSVLQAALRARVDACKVLFQEAGGTLTPERSARIVGEVADIARSGLETLDSLVAAARHRLSARRHPAE